MTIHPDNTLRARLTEAGHRPLIYWQQRGPKNTGIAWLECMNVGKSIVIVQTFTAGGWEAYTPCNKNDVDATVADVIARCT